MTPATLSYAQSLRVMGQALDALRINSFELEKRGDEYIVRMDRSESTGKLSWDTNFLNSVAERFWQSGDFTAPKVYKSSDIDRLDSQGRSGRGGQDSMRDTRRLSLALRALGDYLEQSGARDFAVSWSVDSVRVKYQTNHSIGLKEEDFTVQNLYDRGVHMYMRRSDRRHAT
jgi:hypothetical protein